jgi:hypothetical protein
MEKIKTGGTAPTVRNFGMAQMISIGTVRWSFFNIIYLILDRCTHVAFFNSPAIPAILLQFFPVFFMTNSPRVFISSNGSGKRDLCDMSLCDFRRLLGSPWYAKIRLS